MPYGLTGKAPPRSIEPGDVVACYCEELEQWTAAQLTDLNPSWKTVGVLELDWSGPEPASVKDLGHPAPLILSHHAFANRVAHTNFPWVLPRGCKVIGRLPLLRSGRSDSYSTGWHLGMQLAAQRRWDRGDRTSSTEWPGMLRLDGTQVRYHLRGESRPAIWSLGIEAVDELDCAELVRVFPRLRRLTLHGKLGQLANGRELNSLTDLRMLAITDLFGLTKGDCLLPQSTPELEWLALHSVPREYGAAMRSVWAREIPNGCLADFSALRAPEWLGENLDNPLRDWDGRGHISPTKFRKSVSQYKSTRRRILAVLSSGFAIDLKAQIVAIGHEYGEAFNQLARRDDFIETEEREELFEALISIPKSAAIAEAEAQQVSEWLVEGVDAVRDW